MRRGTDQEAKLSEGRAAAAGRALVAARFAEAASRLDVHVEFGEPLARHTTFRIGGPADLFAPATTPEQLSGLAELATEHGIPATILGGGSNVLVSDAGVRGLVIANRTRRHGIGRSFAEAGDPSEPEGQLLIAESGVMLAGLARWAIRHGLTGLEWAVSVPGTIGGAVIGNAGAHGSDIAANLAWVTVYLPGQGLRQMAVEELGYGYRTSVLKAKLTAGGDRPIVLSAAFRLSSGEPTAMAARAEEFLARRRASQPVEPSIGSIFRNPPGDYAGRLIESTGLKGERAGGAQISTRHANFIVNVNAATAADVICLMNLVRRRVYEMAGVMLVPEIVFLGDWAADPLLAL